MPTKMKRNCTNLDELTNGWSSGDNVYGSGCQLKDTTPAQLFELSFADRTDKFLHALTTNEKDASNQNQNTQQYVIKPWNTKSPTIRQRTVACKSVECGMAFFLKTYKSITTKMTQTVFVESATSITMYCVSQSRSENKDCEHMLIDRWTIKQIGDSAVAVSINVNILWKSYKAATASAIKAKWLTFYRSRFDAWRDRMKESVLMAPYVGCWNKLNSFHSIRIGVDLIEYSDGSKFEVTVRRPKVQTKASRSTANLSQIVAKYSDSEFKGQLIRRDSIEWDNGSVWIRDGFKRFAGEYTQSESGETYVIDATGNITMRAVGKRLRFQLVAHDLIGYKYKPKGAGMQIGTLSREGIKWDNGEVWKAKAKAKVGSKGSSEEDTDESRSKDVAVDERDERIESVSSAAESDVGENSNVSDESVAEFAKLEAEPEIRETREVVEKNQKERDRDIEEHNDDYKDAELPKMMSTDDADADEGEREKEAVADGESQDNENDDTDFEQDFEHYFEPNSSRATAEMGLLSISIRNDEHFVVVEDTNAKLFHSINVKDDWLLV